MYPNVHDPHGYSSEGHPVPQGHPEHNTSATPYPRSSYGSTDSLPRLRTLGRWTSGLCHCFDDPVNCFITCFCPCITFGQTSEILNKGEKSCGSRGLLYGLLVLTCFPCFYSCFYRSKLRGQYDLPEQPCADCLVHFYCLQCALCQEFRELRNRGFDMSIGWEANVERQKRTGITMAPVAVPAMTR